MNTLLYSHVHISEYLMRATLILLLFPLSVSADVSQEQKPEVQHLLDFVRNSSCEMIRNGSHHNGEKAASHIQSKYNYYRSKIRTTEDFIEYSATKSMMSGKYYHVKCNETELKTKDWLLDELKKFRNVK